MTERCTHCREPVEVPLRDIAQRPVCGLCAAKRLRLIPMLLSALFDPADKPQKEREDG